MHFLVILILNFFCMILASLYVGVCVCVLLIIGLIGTVGLCFFFLDVIMGHWIHMWVQGLCWFNRKLHDLILFWICLYIFYGLRFQRFNLIFLCELNYLII
jgi:hypothetical protein